MQFDVSYLEEKTNAQAMGLTMYDPSNATKKLVLKVNKTNLTGAGLLKLVEAEKIFDEVVNSSVFWFLVMTRWEETTERRGMDYQAFHDYLLSGKATHSPVEDNTADIDVWLYKSSWWSKVVGYSLPTSWGIWVAQKYFAQPLGIASNLFHEYLHEAGFRHDGRWASSIPYLIGNTIFEEAFKKLKTV